MAESSMSKQHKSNSAKAQPGSIRDEGATPDRVNSTKTKRQTKQQQQQEQSNNEECNDSTTSAKQSANDAGRKYSSSHGTSKQVERVAAEPVAPHHRTKPVKQSSLPVSSHEEEHQSVVERPGGSSRRKSSKTGGGITSTTSGIGGGSAAAAAAAATSDGVDRKHSSSAKLRSSSSLSVVTTGVQQLSLSATASSELNRRLGDLKLCRKDVGRNAPEVNKLCDFILRSLKASDRPSRSWELLPTGSYYEKVKIDQPEEYDCMFTCDYGRLIAECHSPCKCALRIPSEFQTELVIKDGKSDYFSPLKFKEIFKTKIQDFVSNKPKELEKHKIYLQIDSSDSSSPAVTLMVEMESGVKFHIDLVPAVRLTGWPKTASGWAPPWLTGDEIDNIKAKQIPCVVPKLYSRSDGAAADGDSKYWRLSFSAAEKEIIFHADGTLTHSGTTKKTTCKKDILRLLKADLVEYKKLNGSKSTCLCSYDLKTIFLHLLDQMVSDGDWTKAKIPERYADALGEVIKSLTGRTEIKHYFTGDNLLKLRQPSHPNDFAQVKKFFEYQLEKLKHF